MTIDRRRRAGRIATAIMSLALVASTAVGAVATTPAPAGAASVGDFIAGASRVFGDGSKIFEGKGYKAHIPYAYGLALASDFLTLFGVGREEPSGPSIQDVLNKLDTMSQQLDAIQTQLNAIQTQLGALGAAIAQEIHAATCTTQHGLQNPAVASVTLLARDYQGLLQDEAHLADATHPAEAVATLDRSFSEFTNNVLGPGDSLLISSWPMAQRISEIHTALMGSGPDQDGLIRTCGRVALEQWQGTLKANPKAGWVDDRSYYQGIDDEVRWYQSYQVQALGYIEEAGYYRAAQLYAREYPSEKLSPSQPGAVCRLALDKHPDGATAKLCRSIATELESARKDLAAEWQLAGVPYSNDQVVLSIPSFARGSSGDVRATLWIREPSTLPDGRGYSTFGDPPSALSSYGGYRGWRIATTDDWAQLYGALKESGGNGDSVLTTMNTSGAFRAILPPKWTDLEKADKDSYALWALSKSFYWVPGQIKEFNPSAGEIKHATVRCFVSMGGLAGGIECSPEYTQYARGEPGYFTPGTNLGAALSSAQIVADLQPGGKPLTTWTPKEPIEWTVPVPDSITVDGKKVSCLDILGLPRPCGTISPPG